MLTAGIRTRSGQRPYRIRKPSTAAQNLTQFLSIPFGIGSCSRDIKEQGTILQRDPHVQLDRREFSFLTLDLPTSPRGPEGEESRSFYEEVILPLVRIQKTREDNLYRWLEIMFKFCAGKPFAYYSRYVPSPKIHRIGWLHDVKVVHFPLQRIPERLRRRNQIFRFMALTPAQWEELQLRRSECRRHMESRPLLGRRAALSGRAATSVVHPCRTGHPLLWASCEVASQTTTLHPAFGDWPKPQ